MTVIILDSPDPVKPAATQPKTKYLVDLLAGEGHIPDDLSRAIEAGIQSAQTARKSTDRDWSKVAPLFNRAVTLYEKGQITKALDALTQVSASCPAHKAVLLNMGAWRMLAGDPLSGVTSLIHAIEMGADDSNAWNSIALCFKALKTYDLAEKAFQRALTLDPAHTNAQMNYAEFIGFRGNTDEAYSRLTEILAQNPGNELALCARANTCIRAKNYAQALDDFERLPATLQRRNAVNYTAALNRMGALELSIKVADQALKDSKKPDPNLMINKSNALLGLGERGKAFEILSKALELHKDDANIFWNLSLILLGVGEFETGLDLYEHRFRTSINSDAHFPPASKRWNGTDSLKGKTFFVLHEQGVGDAIQYCRYVNLLAARGAKVVFQTHPAAVGLVATLAAPVTVISNEDPWPQFDYFCPLMSLPKAFETRVDTIPCEPSYLSADPSKVRDWAKKLVGCGKLKIGVSWSGNPHHSNDVSRSIPLSVFERLFKEIDAQFYVLQTTFKEGDKDLLGQHRNVHDWSGELKEFADTAALLKNMDLVISVDTSVVHIAGALGKPVWTLISTSHDYRWIADQTTSPWYPSMRLLRQQQYGKWEPVLDEAVRLANDFKAQPLSALNQEATVPSAKSIVNSAPSATKPSPAQPKGSPAPIPEIRGWLKAVPDGYRAQVVADGFSYVHMAAAVDSSVTVGRGSYINGETVLGGKFPVRIGAFCSISTRVYCWTNESHQTDYVSTYPFQTILGMTIGYPEVIERPQGVTIGNDVWIGNEARIMPGVTIGDGVIVGARALVTKDLEPYGIYGGVPAKLIRKRFAQPVIDALCDIKWWQWSLVKIRANANFFNLKLTEISDPAILYDAIVEVDEGRPETSPITSAAQADKPAAIVCKVCSSEAHYVDSVDLNKNCEERRGIVLPKSGEQVPYFQCEKCRLLFTPFMDKWSKADFAKRIYNDEYIVVDPDYKKVRPEALAKTVKDFASKVGAKHLLDYGAGEGLMAKLLRAQGFACDAWDPFGSAKQRKIKRKSYDLVTSFEVFEHTATPSKTVNDILSYAKNEALVLFSTLAQADPQRPSVDSWYVSPRNGHITIYSLESLRELFGRFGWQVHHFSHSMHLAYKVRPSFLN